MHLHKQSQDLASLTCLHAAYYICMASSLCLWGCLIGVHTLSFSNLRWWVVWLWMSLRYTYLADGCATQVAAVAERRFSRPVLQSFREYFCDVSSNTPSYLVLPWWCSTREREQGRRAEQNCCRKKASVWLRRYGSKICMLFSAERPWSDIRSKSDTNRLPFCFNGCTWEHLPQGFASKQCQVDMSVPAMLSKPPQYLKRPSEEREKLQGLDTSRATSPDWSLRSLPPHHLWMWLCDSKYHPPRKVTDSSSKSILQTCMHHVWCIFWHLDGMWLTFAWILVEFGWLLLNLMFHCFQRPLSSNAWKTLALSFPAPVLGTKHWNQTSLGSACMNLHESAIYIYTAYMGVYIYIYRIVKMSYPWLSPNCNDTMAPTGC